MSTIRFTTPMLRSDMCDYSDAYFIAKKRINVERTNTYKREDEKLTFKNTAPFISCISKTNNTIIDNIEDFDIAMPMHNLLEYSNNYSMTS